ncbi:TRAP transporter large permease [Microbaculum marinum]|uniref:TRAP transporter large permease protein n=1 Tax=Microbaculum marinum TaxID=1764581 RepID=A0AAW9S1X9_9HYPH
MGDVFPVILMFATLFVLMAIRTPIAFALLASSFGPILIEERLSLLIVAQRTYNSLDTFLLLAVPFFLLAGSLMNETGITVRLIRFAAALVGHLRGGLAQINVVVSMMFAGISGSSLADVAGAGTILIPAMRDRGFPVAFSVAITATSSVMGVLIPPSLLLIVWGAVTGTSIGALFIGGIVPGVVLGLSLMIAVYVIARRRSFPVEERRDRSEIVSSLKDAILALFMPVVVVGGIRLGWFTPTEASIIAVLYALALGLVVYRSVAIRRLPTIFFNAAKLVSTSMFCVGSAGVFGFLLAYYRVPQLLAELAGGFSSPALLLIAISCLLLVLGTFLDGLVIAIICGPLFLPAVTNLGVHPVHYGLVSCMAIAIGVVTPPYGLCLLMAASIGKIPVASAFPDTFRLIGAMLAALLLVILVPAITVGLVQVFGP